MAASYFTSKTFAFLKDLKANNDRDWFLANRDRYEQDVKQPMLAFIADFSGALRKISPQFVADPKPVGGSMFRIHRDTRFAKDKSPYKTHVAAQFRHEKGGRDVHAPGFYLHVAPGECFGGGGLWHPDPPALKRVRDAIVARERDWAKLRAAPHIEVQGESVKRPPTGYPAGHRFIDDLKLKDYYTMTKFSEKDACGAGFIDRYAGACRSAAPLVKFLTGALGLRW